MEKEVGEEQYLKDIYAAMIDPAERKLLIDVFGKLPNRAEIQQAFESWYCKDEAKMRSELNTVIEAANRDEPDENISGPAAGFLVAAFGVPSARGKMIKMNVIEAVLGALQQAKRLDIWCLMILHCFMASSEGLERLVKANAYQTVLQSMKREALAKRELSKTVLRGCCMLVFGTLHEKCRHWNEAEKISDKQIVEISVLLAKYRKEIASLVLFALSTFAAAPQEDADFYRKMLDDVLWFLAVGWQKEEQSWYSYVLHQIVERGGLSGLCHAMSLEDEEDSYYETLFGVLGRFTASCSTCAQGIIDAGLFPFCRRVLRTPRLQVLAGYLVPVTLNKLFSEIHSEKFVDSIIPELETIVEPALLASQKAFEEEEHPSVLTLSEKLCMSVFANDRQLDNAARFCFEHPSFIPVQHLEFVLKATNKLSDWPFYIGPFLVVVHRIMDTSPKLSIDLAKADIVKIYRSVVATMKEIKQSCLRPEHQRLAWQCCEFVTKLVASSRSRYIFHSLQTFFLAKEADWKTLCTQLKSLIGAQEALKSASDFMAALRSSDKSWVVTDKGSKKCDVCNKTGKILHCGACTLPGYCSVHCQKRHWKCGHREECKEMKQTLG